MGEKLMAKKESIHDFIYFQYKPLRIKGFIETMLLFTIVCVGAYFLNRGRWLAVFSAVFGGACWLTCFVSYILLPDCPPKRFIVESVWFSYTAIILNLGASQIIGAGSSIIITVFFLFLLVLCAVVLVSCASRNIKRDKYKNMSPRTSMLGPLMGAIFGRSIAKVLFSRISNDAIELFLGYLLLLLSLFFSAGIAPVLKLYLYCKVEKKNTD